MDSGPWLRDVFILLGLAVLNGFFSLAEMAVVSSRKARLKAGADAGKIGYAQALKTAGNPGPFLSTIQIAITLIGLVSGAFGGATLADLMAKILAQIPLLAPWADALGLAAVLLILTFASIIIGELVPKQIALSNPERIASGIVGPLRIIQTVFWPVERFLSATTRLILRIFHIRESPDTVVTTEEIRVMLHEGEQGGTVERQEKAIVEHVFHLGDRKVEAYMTHRSEIEWLPVDSGIDEIKALLHMRNQYHLIPVCRENLDEIVGMVDTYRLLLSLVDGSYHSLTKSIRPALYIPASMSALKAMDLFRRQKVDAGVVLDEYGGVKGIVDLLSLMDALSGDSENDNSDSYEGVVYNDDGSYRVDGGTDIHAFCTATGIQLPEASNSAFQTAAGYALYVAQYIPRDGDRIPIPEGTLEIEVMDGNRIVSLRFIPDNPASD